MNVDEIDSVTPDMDLTAGYVFRAPTEIVLDANFLRNGWRRAGFDLARDAWVVVDRGGTVVGYGHAMRGEPTVVESLGIEDCQGVIVRRAVLVSSSSRVRRRASSEVVSSPAGAACRGRRRSGPPSI